MKYHCHKALDNLCSKDYYEHHLSVFVKRCQNMIDEEHQQKNFHWKTELTINNGRRYDKIVSSDIGTTSNQSRVYAFIDKTNGDILKPATWKAPAKHARGNIYDDDCMQFMSPYGPAYMDTIKSYYGA